jgi:hypothetical protein
MPRGSKPGERRGGRQRGTPNRASVERQAEVASTGATPLATMIAKMRFHLAAAEKEMAKGEEADVDVILKAFDKAAEAAHDAAPYVHPRLAAVQHTGKEEGPIEVKSTGALDEFMKRIRRLAAAQALNGQHPNHGK